MGGVGDKVACHGKIVPRPTSAALWGILGLQLLAPGRNRIDGRDGVGRQAPVPRLPTLYRPFTDANEPGKTVLRKAEPFTLLPKLAASHSAPFIALAPKSMNLPASGKT